MMRLLAMLLRSNLRGASRDNDPLGEYLRGAGRCDVAPEVLLGIL